MPAATCSLWGWFSTRWRMGNCRFPGVSRACITGAWSFRRIPRTRVPADLDALIARAARTRSSPTPANAEEVRDQLQKLARTPSINQKALAGAAALLLFCSGWIVDVLSPGQGAWRHSAGLTNHAGHFLPGDEWDPSLSPDGNQVAFSWDGENGENRDIYVTQIGELTPKRLTARPCGGQLSRRGRPTVARLLSFASATPNTGTIAPSPPLGGPARKLYDLRFSHNPTSDCPSAVGLESGQQADCIYSSRPGTDSASTCCRLRPAWPMSCLWAVLHGTWGILRPPSPPMDGGLHLRAS